MKPRQVPAPKWSIAALHESISRGARTSVSIVEECLATIDRDDCAINAWALVTRDLAHAQAREADAALREGRRIGPLHGIPFGVKDIIDVAGVPTAAGVETPHHVPTQDAELVAQLRAAGAIVLGKTVTTPFAWIDPPATVNPWDHARTPGGSSSGSAAAVAAAMCPFALGSQTGGSLMRPAAFCGVASLKPSYGKLSTRGVLPLATSLDHPGLIAPTASDLATLWRILSPSDFNGPASTPPRIGRLGGMFRELAEPAANDAIALLLDASSAAGAVACPVPLPPRFDEVTQRHRVIMAAEAAAYHEQARAASFPFPPKIGDLIDEGRAIKATSYIKAIEYQNSLKAAFEHCFDGVDVLLTPTAPGAAPNRDTTGNPVFNSPFSLLGLPTVTIPAGVEDRGMPIGAQLIGKRGREVELLAFACWCEQAIAHAYQ